MISNTSLRDDLVAQLGATDFPFTFPVYDKHDLIVITNSRVENLDSDYVVMSGTGLLENLPIDSIPATGFVRFILPRQQGDVVSIIPTQSVVQKSVYTNEPFPPRRVERDFDKVVMITRMLLEMFQRTPTLSIDSLLKNITIEDPVAGKHLAWDATGTQLVNVDSGPKGETGAQGPQGVPGAGAAPIFTDGLQSVDSPTEVQFGANFTVDEPGLGIARINYTPPPVAGVPTGVWFPYAGASLPTGYLWADGSAVSRTTYAALFAAIGTLHGPGDGSTTFNVPDPRGRALVGAGVGVGLTARVRGSKFGEETHTLTLAETPSHSHTVTDPGHTHNLATGSGGVGGNQAYIFGSGSFTGYQSTYVAAASTGITISSAGGGLPHNIMQPSLAENFIIKY